MARIRINPDDIRVVMADGLHRATSYQIHRLEDRETLERSYLLAEELESPKLYDISLTMRYPDGELYPPELPSISRVKLHFGESETAWVDGICLRRNRTLDYELPAWLPNDPDFTILPGEL